MPSSPRNAPGAALSLRADTLRLKDGHAPRAVLFGVGGYRLSADEMRFFRDADPLGFILFTRNAENPAQFSDLTAALRDCMGRDVPVLLDQEGGRVARLRAPHWPEFPAAKTFGDANDERGAYDNAAAIAQMLAGHGVNVNCTPVVDVLFPETHPAIGNRAFSSDPAVVAKLGAAVIRAHLDQGVIPVVKHMPGQGRANLDSHVDLPVVSSTREDIENIDLFPYREIFGQEFARNVWGMVSHIIYSDIDPDNPATCSPVIIDGVIRQQLGFSGFLLSDDIVMQALARIGDMGRRAARTVEAGCDAVLHCSGVMDEMVRVAEDTPLLSPASVGRFNDSLRQNRVEA